MKIGVISDTHGLLRPEAVEALRGTDHILHAGDVGDIEIVHRLQEIAPVTAIRGNVDRSGPCSLLPETEYLELAGHNLFLIHDLSQLDLNPIAAGVACVIYGHSHQPSEEWKKGVLYFNPGSAGARRFSLPVSVGFLELTDTVFQPSLRNLLG
ncbi:metallophosphoesterase family protein [Silvibacterium acidisoli]|uniref:metallophosphoesterase family protein n=1 Tax=Acidobacteriaceae bacterium ZG23-2 TaxID=2883246 RepID=UPI00406D0935